MDARGKAEKGLEGRLEPASPDAPPPWVWLLMAELRAPGRFTMTVNAETGHPLALVSRRQTPDSVDLVRLAIP